jgi:membrane-bound metal-dependent hydrolase YbcI (DUF457 family)
MVGFSSHFAIGLIASIVFVIWDKKGRYRTLIVGGFAATLPDIDAPGVYVEFIEHRGFVHSPLMWIIASLLAFVGVLLLVVYDFSRNKQDSPKEIILDKFYYFGAFTVGWLTHIIADFGFTEYEDQNGMLLSLNWEHLYILDNLMGLLVAVFLGAIIWFEIKDKPRKTEAVGRFHRLQVTK